VLGKSPGRQPDIERADADAQASNREIRGGSARKRSETLMKAQNRSGLAACDSSGLC